MPTISGKKILVTGGAGFVGSSIVESLVKQGAQVTVYDNFSSGFEENLKPVRDSIELIRGDILDYPKLLATARGKDILSHQAAQLEILRAMDDPVDDLQTNTVGTLNALKACVEGNVPRFIMPSSAGVYGQAKFVPETEDHPTEPQWAYGVSKLACEKYAKIFETDYGLKPTLLRYAIVYGPREWFGRVLPIFLKRLLDDKPPVIFGDGQQIRDFVYVQDVVRFHNRCLEETVTEGQIYNVSSGVGTTITDLAKACIAASGKNIDPIYEDVPEGKISSLVDGRKRIPSELKVLVQSYEKAQKDFGWKPQTSLLDGLRSQWEWLQDHKDRYSFGSMRV